MIKGKKITNQHELEEYLKGIKQIKDFKIVMYPWSIEIYIKLRFMFFPTRFRRNLQISIQPMIPYTTSLRVRDYKLYYWQF